MSITSFIEKDVSFNAKVAKWLLKYYFKQPLCREELNVLTNFGFITAQDVWLKAMRHRDASDIEIVTLIGKMPWHLLRRFPFKLSENYLAYLFANRNPQKIVAYCRDYSLPESFEIKLIENYRQSLKIPDAKMLYTYFGGTPNNGWAKALEAYLENAYSDERLTTKDAQMRLLDLGDNQIIEKLILRCSIIRNPLHKDVIWRLIAESQVDMLRLLLRESYIDAPAIMVDLIKNRMPQILAQYILAEQRRKTYLKELQNQVSLGGLTFTEQEKWIVKKHQKTEADDIPDFVSSCIDPRMKAFSPCMRTYLAYYFPEFADRLLMTSDFA